MKTCKCSKKTFRCAECGCYFINETEYFIIKFLSSYCESCFNKRQDEYDGTLIYDMYRYVDGVYRRVDI